MDVLTSANVRGLFRVPWFLPDCTQDAAGHESSCVLRLLVAVAVSQTLRVFDDLGSFDGFWSDILRNMLQLGFV